MQTESPTSLEQSPSVGLPACPVCSGRGYVLRRVWVGRKYTQIAAPCPECQAPKEKKP